MIRMGADEITDVRPPLSNGDVESLEAGDRVRITGLIYTVHDTPPTGGSSRWSLADLYIRLLSMDEIRVLASFRHGLMTMIPTRDPTVMINLSRSANGDYMLRIGTREPADLDRRSLEALDHAIAQFLRGTRERKEIPTRRPTDTITLHYRASGDSVLRIGGGGYADLEQSDLQTFRDAIKQLLAPPFTPDHVGEKP